MKHPIHDQAKPERLLAPPLVLGSRPGCLPLPRLLPRGSWRADQPGATSLGPSWAGLGLTGRLPLHGLWRCSRGGAATGRENGLTDRT